MSTAALVSSRRTSKLPLLFGLSALIILLDRVTKVWVSNHIELGSARTIIPGVFSISHVLNDGAAFSLFSYSSRPQLVRIMLIAFSIIAALAVFAFLLKLGRQLTATTVALALILGGAIGNVYDRLVYGTVIDFLEVHIILGHWNYHWPDFNVADSAIVCGGILLFLGALRGSSDANV
ncbi:Lipoprotein signal peptidase [Acidisarcina polymorpha]|uniref:Lipoprotein signal peptidase n=1 Tax=Acidisarcina polymorpha TaxID=2211140 RepID=A0A2Z5G1N8_9BACT|nr:signal peptidase II [Acidisarcina polymorpha]AXC12565.1 Lipoprotein signal peptidase [Acidisarcina polymorpha]